MNKFKIIISGLCALVLLTIFSMFIVFLVYENDKPYIVWTVLSLIILIDFLFALAIMNSSKYTNIKLCWVFIVLAFPMIGNIIFLIFGTTPFKKKVWKEYNQFQAHYTKCEKFYSNKDLKLIKNDLNIFNLAKYNSFRPIYKYNKISIINNNCDLFKSSIKLIRTAKETIHIQMYIIKDGIWMRSLTRELIKKAKAGVKVRIIYDWVGCLFCLPKDLMKAMKNNGIEIAIFNPHGINMFKGATNYRSHRKAIIIDNKKALFGGSNIGDEYLSIDPKTNYWKDLNFLIEGEIINTLNLLFCIDYCHFSNVKINSDKFNEVYKNIDKILVPKKSKNILFAQVLDSSPDYQGKPIKNEIINLILKAKKSINIISPYFFPTDDIIDAIIIASYTGVKIRMIFPGKNDDKNFVLAMNQSNYEKILHPNIKIYEYDGFIHSKSIVIDNEFILTGSFNLDYRSLWINFENAILLKDKKASTELTECFNKDIENCKLIDKRFIDKHATLKNKITLLLISIYHPLL